MAFQKIECRFGPIFNKLEFDDEPESRYFSAILTFIAPVTTTFGSTASAMRALNTFNELQERLTSDPLGTTFLSSQLASLLLLPP